MKRILVLLMASILLLGGCNRDGNAGKKDQKGNKQQSETVTEEVVDSEGEVTLSSEFWMGADISWSTEMEKNGEKLYSFTGDEPWECTALMKELGLNAIRLRVWVDPLGWEMEQKQERSRLIGSLFQPVEDNAAEDPAAHMGKCDKEDLLVKAMRAKELGMAIMVDFHYSDSWADAGKQPVPHTWKGLSYDQMADSLRQHTKDVLQMLKDNGIKPKWVQIGNETSNGLLWSYKTGREGMRADGARAYEDSIGCASMYPDNYAGLIGIGHRAVKSIFPDALTIVHLDNGWDKDLYDWNLDILRRYHTEYDMVGMSLYPYWAQLGDREDSSADEIISECIANIRRVSSKFGKDVMIVETGFEVNEKKEAVNEEGRRLLERVLKEARYNTGGRCKGVFYWEPECRPARYKLGAFTSDGRPTAIMKAWSSFDGA